MRACVYLLIILLGATLALAQGGVISYEQINVHSASPAKGLATTTLEPPGIPPPTHCTMRVESASVRYRLDGGTATETSGMVMTLTDVPLSIVVQDVARLSVQGNVSSKTAILSVHCGRTPIGL